MALMKLNSAVNGTVQGISTWLHWVAWLHSTGCSSAKCAYPRQESPVVDDTAAGGVERAGR